ncbi:hypothetical protein E2C01_068151 [Portunus trituberculatus]|uniref:Uncharacterized protein n=1 Tax=Portunus trituberculatus TaxID=210409 RepID=A0A5B7HV10_PORTR|nr:hypothetical protein [Portunus trituberculatus]
MSSASRTSGPYMEGGLWSPEATHLCPHAPPRLTPRLPTSTPPHKRLMQHALNSWAPQHR